MQPTTVCALQFDLHFAEYALLDDAGELLEAGKLRMSQRAVWNRFAALPPSAVAVNYDPNYLWAVDLLTQMGHTVLFTGRMSAEMAQELKPVVGDLPGTMLVCPPKQGQGAGLYFLVTADGERILEAHYLVGPVTAETKMARLAEVIPAATANPEAAPDSAGRLHQFVATGMMPLPEVTFGGTGAGKARGAAA